MFSYTESLNQDQFMPTRPRISGSGQPYGLTYPSPFFDVAQTYLPDSIRSLFRWCRYYYLTNPIIFTIVNKMAEYPITDIIIESGDKKTDELWMSLLEDTLRIRTFLIDFGLYYYCFGNSLTSIFFPFIKFLKCGQCGHRAAIKECTYRFHGFRFFLNPCPKCGSTGEATARDVAIKSPEQIRLTLWNPEDIVVVHNDVTGDRQYYFDVPRSVRNDIMMGKPHVIEVMPQLILDAVRDQKQLRISPGSIFHSHRPSLLAGTKDAGLGVPLIMPVLKDNFSLQILKKANEAIALERIYPLSIVFPQANSAMVDPLSSIHLGKWREHVQQEIGRWRLDRGYIPIMPVPLGHQVIGGEGRGLLMFQEVQMLNDLIISGMGVPREFVLGGLSWCVDPDTYIFSHRGMLHVGDICPESGSEPRDEVVATHAGLQRVLLSHSPQLREMTRLRTRLGLDITSSPAHRFLRLDKDLETRWVEAGDLNPGDFIAIRAGANIWPSGAPRLDEAIAKADETDKRDTSQGFPVQLPEVLTPELARLLGYLVAEGSSSEVKRERISFSQVPGEVSEDFVYCMNKVFGYEPSVLNQTGERHFGGPICSIEITRGRAVRFLRALGLGARSADISVPPCIRMAPWPLVREFLRAYFEGDGGVTATRTKQCVFAVSTSERLLQEVQLLLLNAGIVSSRYFPSRVKNTYSLQIRSEYVDRFRDCVGFVSSRKSEVLENLSPTGTTHIGERIPYVKEALDDFRADHFGSRSCWVHESSIREFRQEEYTTAELAALFDRDVSSVNIYRRKGKLTPKEYRPGENGKFGSYIFSREEAQRFLREHGLGKRRTVPVRGMDGATYSKLLDGDLTFIKEKNPKLASKILKLLNEKFIWADVRSIEKYEQKIPMVDLTVDGDHSYVANGLVTHNSGSNVSMRMLENQMLRYISDLMTLVSKFIIKNIAAYLDWPVPKMRFKPFKMADDLQQRSLLFQYSQANKISDETLLSNSDLNAEKEDQLMRQELKRRTESIRKLQLAQAEIQGEVQVIMSKYQARAQAVMMREQQQAQAGTENAAPGEARAEVPGAEVAPQGALPPQPEGGGMAPGVPLEAPPAPPPPPPAPMEVAYQMAQQLVGMPEDYKQMAIQQIGMQDPQLAEMVVQVLGQMGGGASSSAMQSLPEQLPPRRGPENAVI